SFSSWNMKDLSETNLPSTPRTRAVGTNRKTTSPAEDRRTDKFPNVTTEPHKLSHVRECTCHGPAVTPTHYSVVSTTAPSGPRDDRLTLRLFAIPIPIRRVFQE